MDLLLGGWQLSGIHVAAERPGADGDARGAPACSTSAANGARVRTWWAIPSCRTSERTIDRWFNTDAFARVLSGAAGVRQRRRRASCAVRGTPTSTSRLAKNFPVGDRRSVQFRTEVFNAFNRANFGPPNIARDSSGFGQILSAGNARIVQFGLKFYF